MSVTHADPDPGHENPLNLNHPKDHSLTLSDFLQTQQSAPPRLTWKTEAPEPHRRPAPTVEGPQPYWQALASQLLAARNSFAARNAVGDNPRCSAPDRSAVLAVYNEALQRIEHLSTLDARRLNIEITQKVTTILDLRCAQPGDAVFFVDSAFLSPLEPQYAHPRLDYYDRGVAEGSDGYGRAAWMRLREWRRDRWPVEYPGRAVERERKERERRKRRGTKVDTDLEGLERVVAGEWGDEVDADPERLWR